MSLLLDCIRVLLAGYLLLLAAAALLGAHRTLFSYPAQAIYATVRLAVLAFTFGRVRMTPLARATRRRSGHRMRRVRFALSEVRDRRRADPEAPRAGWSRAGSHEGPRVGGAGPHEAGSDGEYVPLGELDDDPPLV
jgi:hypothetical protein